MRIVFAGTPEFALPSLEAIVASDHELVGVLTQPDRRAGRGRQARPSPVKARALALDVPIEQPARVRGNAAVQDWLTACQADVLVVVAYGQILPAAVLETPRYGAINVHGSLLPRWRGAAPIARAIQAGDEESGVTIMQMAAGLDTGDMLAKRRTPITATTTAGALHDCLAKQGAEALRTVLDGMPDGLNPEPQDEAQACYARRLDKAEAAVDWQQSAVEIARLIRAFSPWPVAHAGLAGQRLRLWQAEAEAAAGQAPPGTVVAAGQSGLDVATGDGVLRITELQLPGKRRMAAADAANGRDWMGTRLD